MLKDKEFPVYGDNGLRGTLRSAARFLDPSPEKRVRLEDGREIVVPSSALVAQPDGSYYLHTSTPQGTDGPSIDRPTADRETPMAEPEPPRQASTPAAPEPPKPVATPTAAAPASEPLFREDCDVERVPIGRFLEKPVETRQDGDTLIIPLMEEVLVVEKRLMLREELHIKRRRETKPDDPRIPLK